MKRFIIFLILFNFITPNSFSNELNDCSAYSKFSPEYYKCKSTNFINKTKNYQKKEWLDEKEKINKIKKKVLD